MPAESDSPMFELKASIVGRIREQLDRWSHPDAKVR